jgi:hypothetical protein
VTVIDDGPGEDIAAPPPSVPLRPPHYLLDPNVQGVTSGAALRFVLDHPRLVLPANAYPEPYVQKFLQTFLTNDQLTSLPVWKKFSEARTGCWPEFWRTDLIKDTGVDFSRETFTEHCKRVTIRAPGHASHTLRKKLFLVLSSLLSLSPDHQITRSPDHQITRSPDHQMTR